MKALRLLFFFLLSVLAVTVILSMLMATSQKVERTVTINAPATVIYKELIKLENFNKYSVWSQRDPSAKYTLTGTDGVVGAASSWIGNPEISGEGKIEITSLQENKKVSHKLSFTKPKKGTATSSFTLSESNGTTSVTWHFELATPRPWNIFNLFSSLDKNMGKDFEDGLALLKSSIEKINGNAPAKTYAIETMNFPGASFAAIRQQVKWADFSDFYSQHLPIIFEEAQKQNASPGTASSLFYNWDEKDQIADVAAAYPVTSGSKFENNIIQLVSIDASKALYVDFHGSYDKLPDAYAGLRKYINENSLKQKTPSIEQYITGPFNEKDTAKWLTKVVFLVE